MTITTTPANLKKYWDFVNRCEVDDPAETRTRCSMAVKVLDKAPVDIDTYNEMMDALVYIVRESYHR